MEVISTNQLSTMQIRFDVIAKRFHTIHPNCVYICICMYICIYIYTYVCVDMCIYIYIYLGCPLNYIYIYIYTYSNIESVFRPCPVPCFCKKKIVVPKKSHEVFPTSPVRNSKAGPSPWSKIPWEARHRIHKARLQKSEAKTKNVILKLLVE